ncbi:MAG: invasion associated locus B family protein [Paracoccaceae bacterium]
MNRSRLILSTAAAMGLGLAGMLSSGALAQSQTEQTAQQQSVGSTGWSVQCNTVADQLQCSALNSIVATPGNQLILRVSIQVAADGGDHNLIVQLPLGLDLPKGIDLSVDEGASTHFEINTCIQAGCFVTHSLEETTLSDMKAGETLAITMFANNGGENQIQLPLAGFTNAVEKL